MLKRFDVGGYQVIPADADKGVSWTADLDAAGVDVELEVRAEEGAFFYLVNEDGEKVFVDSGPVVSFKARAIGAAQLVVESDGDIAIRSRAVRSVFGEKVDPVPAAIGVRRPLLNPIDYQVRLAVEQRLRAMGLSEDVVGAVNEELEDVGGLDGDFELEDEDDPFGPGFAEDPQEEVQEAPPAPSEEPPSAPPPQPSPPPPPEVPED